MLPGLTKSDRPKSIILIGASSSLEVKRKFCQVVTEYMVRSWKGNWWHSVLRHEFVTLKHRIQTKQQHTLVPMLIKVPLALDHGEKPLEDDNRQLHLEFAQQ
jgi:hypothetical protein